MNPLPFSATELREFCADTPASGRYAHFAHGSSSLPPAVVFDTQRAWLEAQERHGNYRALKLFEDPLASVRRSVALLINAQEHQIALLDSSTRGWALAFSAACAGPRPIEVLTTEHEWGANALNMLHAQTQGRIAGLHVLYDAGTSAAQQVLARLADVPATRRPLVALQAVSPVDGSRTELSGLAKAIHSREGLLFVDASHAVGQLPVDVQDMGCDVMVFPARKWLRGPKGISVLYLSDHAMETLGMPPTLDIAGAVWQSPTQFRAHTDIRRFEAYEFNPGLRLALKAACDYAMAAEPARIAAQNQIVRANVLDGLRNTHAVEPTQPAHPTALMTFRVRETQAASLLARLEAAGVNASLIGAPYSLWALRARHTNVLLRLTPHYFTEETEVEQLLDVFAALPDTFRLLT